MNTNIRQQAIAAENTNCAKYNLYAAIAGQEKQPKLAALFAAAAQSARIHSCKLKETSHKPQETSNSAPQPPAQEIHLQASKSSDNLLEALAATSGELLELYPALLQHAEKNSGEKSPLYRSLHNAMESKRALLHLLKEALQALDQRQEEQLPEAYQICPLCGYLLNPRDNAQRCPLCGAPAQQFLLIH